MSVTAQAVDDLSSFVTSSQSAIVIVGAGPVGIPGIAAPSA